MKLIAGAEAKPLDEKLCLALYSASRAMTARYRDPLAPLGLTYPQYLVMVLLWEDGHSSVGQIGARLRLESSTLSPLLKRLEMMGLVHRSRDPQDERSVVVALTRQGRVLERRAVGVASQICDAAGLSLEEQGELVAEIKALTAKLTAVRA
ncbi:MarR family winged helix-turn-helix transcriptional regulator [Nakamurella sp. PAMC28650]|uniref:MarR family winged helix-turn-helix transcriptional regulator n=1 Tax=Nakamurella sp. PAMC28650 TaxID=2762325 RepID=UPI00164E5FD5|nr:MarR family transcriptional regulator [Nakamurella sp. PAMC28650]QNK80192.1 MarR family transcriptional regulator [Nakamurella sp. PAMC28650]